MRIKRVLAAFAAGVALLSACTNLEVTMPKGPEGIQGVDGLSAYEVWVKAVQAGKVSDWDPSKVSVTDFFIYLKGAKGDKGDDGLSAYEVWKEYVAGGDVDNPQEPGSKWDPSMNTVKDFYIFLTGPKGDDGLVPFIGDNGNWHIGDTDTGIPATGPQGPKGDDGLIPFIGSDGDWHIGDTDTGIPATGPQGPKGKDGKSAYEVWKDYISSGNVTDPHDGSSKWDSSRNSQADFFWFLTGNDGLTPTIGSNGNWFIDGEDTGKPSKGEDGEDGFTPVIGSNGNWFIDGQDTGKPSRGEKGDNGKTPTIGSNGNWFIDGNDTGVPARGKDGSNGLSAYEIWKADVAKGLDNPGNGVYDLTEYPQWPKSANSQADFWLYLHGKDGVDGTNGTNGTDGKSAYEIWKESVLAEGGLATPDNGVYDPAEQPTWPTDAVSLADFWRYLKGKDGKDGKDGESGTPAEPVEYAEDADPGLYNLVSVRALMKVKASSSSSAVKDTTYEYVNPYSGGAAFLVTAPGPVIVPECEVVFKDVSGNTYTKTSDGNGFIYLSRDELPEWGGYGSKKATAMKPVSFKFGGKTIDDQSKIAATCIVPYRVDVHISMDRSTLTSDRVNYSGSLYRVVEGRVEKSWGGVDFPIWDFTNNVGYKYYRAASAIAEYWNAIGTSTKLAEGVNSPDVLTSNNSGSFSGYALRNNTTSSAKSTEYRTLSYGNGNIPSKVEVGSHVFSVNNLSNGKITVSRTSVDYGMSIVSDERTHIPEIRRAGDIDVTTAVELRRGAIPKPGVDEDAEYSDETADDFVARRWTNYVYEIAQTRFSGSLDPETFGQCYVEEDATLNGDTYEFKRYDTLLDYNSRPNIEGYVATTGKHEGTSIANDKALSNGSWSDLHDMYDGMEFIVGSSRLNGAILTGTVKIGKVHYGGYSCKFSYTEGQYTGKLSGQGTVQVIYLGHANY